MLLFLRIRLRHCVSTADDDDDGDSSSEEEVQTTRPRPSVTNGGSATILDALRLVLLDDASTSSSNLAGGGDGDAGCETGEDDDAVESPVTVNSGRIACRDVGSDAVVVVGAFDEAESVDDADGSEGIAVLVVGRVTSSFTFALASPFPTDVAAGRAARPGVVLFLFVLPLPPPERR